MKRRTRLLHVAGLINPGDFIDTLLRGLDRERFEIAAIVGKAGSTAAKVADFASYPATTTNYPFDRRHIPRLTATIRAAVREYRPDVLHVHHFDENVAATIAMMGLREPAYVIGRHYSDHVYTLTRGLKRRAVLSVERISNNRASHIIVPSQEVVELLVRRQGVPRRKVFCIPYALNISGFKPSNSEAVTALREEIVPGGGDLVLACCRLNREKGLELLLQAFEVIACRHPGARLVLVGDGPYRPFLERLAEELRLGPRVLFAGWRTDAMDWIAAADIVVQPSYSESYCQVLVQALAMERAMIMTPVGAAPEVIGVNERGIMVPIGNAQALADALDKLLSNAALRQQLGQTGRRYVEERLTPAQSVRRHEELYLAAAGR